MSRDLFGGDLFVRRVKKHENGEADATQVAEHTIVGTADPRARDPGRQGRAEGAPPPAGMRLDSLDHGRSLAAVPPMDGSAPECATAGETSLQPAMPKRGADHDHVCAVCGGRAPFGFGMFLRQGKAGRWSCLAHRAQVEAMAK